MKKIPIHHSTGSLEKLDFLDGLEEHAAVQWFSTHWLKFVYAFLLLFLLLFSIYAWKVRGIGKAETDYYNVEQIFQTFQAGKEGSTQAFDTLLKILDRQPDLHAKYDGLIAQILIDRGEINEALPLAQTSLKWIAGEDLPFYVDYSTISLLSAKNQYADALQRSKKLKESMLEEAKKAENSDTLNSFGSTLFAFNLLRIAMLEQKVGTPVGEMEAWKEWQHYMNADVSLKSIGIDNKAFFTLSNGISEGTVTLQNYIDSRMQQLEQLQPNGK